MSAISRSLSFWESALLDPLSATLLGVSALSTAAGTAFSAEGTLAAGKNAQALGQYQNLQYQAEADNAVATAQRQMIDQQRQGGLVQSTLQARAAAGGGTATSPSILNVGSQIAGRSEYNALMDLSSGQDAAAGYLNQGQAAIYGGNLAQQASVYSAAGTVASGAGSMFRTFAMANPNNPWNFSGSSSAAPGSFSNPLNPTFPTGNPYWNGGQG